jgi:predicted RNase H-like nuclease (RuvC/YqgF family)
MDLQRATRERDDLTERLVVGEKKLNDTMEQIDDRIVELEDALQRATRERDVTDMRLDTELEIQAEQLDQLRIAKEELRRMIEQQQRPSRSWWRRVLDLLVGGR